LNELTAQLSDGEQPVQDLEQQRQVALEQRVIAEQDLTGTRTALDGIDNDLRKFEQTRQQRDEQALQQREAIGQRRLEQQALVLKAETLTEAIAEAGAVLQDVVNALDEEADPQTWERAVADLDNKLRRLEPVNLAAIAEHAEAAQRKDYLDAQNTDLTTALETLEE
ncbi:hypothetical protein JTP67_36790, partial [Streptomyces sp. S12]|nr:hypothetical protein [Streptomyces sp. S12]